MELLRDYFKFIFNNQSLKKEVCGKNNELYVTITKKIPKFLASYFKSIDFSDYHLKYSGGCGSWAIIPYITILDPIISKGLNGWSSSIGIYPAYLFSEDCNRIYLTYMLGVGAKSPRDLEETAHRIRSNLDYQPYSDDTSRIFLGYDKRNYSNGVLFYREYTLDNLPEEEVLLNDLRFFIEIHEKVVFQIKKANNLI